VGAGAYYSAQMVIKMKAVFSLSGASCDYLAIAGPKRIESVESGRIISQQRGSGVGRHRNDTAMLEFELAPSAVDDLMALARGLGFSCELEGLDDELQEPVVDVPLDVLDLSVKKLRAALATGDYDMYLEALLEAEESGKTRKTAVEALEDRIGGA
jgi:hypothetical protein